jgi:hypothetical protein
MIVTKAVFMKFMFIRHLFVRKSYTEFHDNLKKKGLFTDTLTDRRTNRQI